MKASKMAYPPSSPFHPIPNPSYTNYATPLLKNFHLVLSPSSLISPAFLYRHCWLWPAQDNPGLRLKCITVTSFTPLESFPIRDNAGYLLGRNDWYGPCPMNPEITLNLITNSIHFHRCSPVTKLPSIEYLPREIHFTYKQSSVSKKILKDYYNNENYSHNNMKRRVIKVKMDVVVEETVVVRKLSMKTRKAWTKNILTVWSQWHKYICGRTNVSLTRCLINQIPFRIAFGC